MFFNFISNLLYVCTDNTTRLRLELKDTSIIDQQKIKNAGAVGVTINGKHSTQVIATLLHN
jgi:phosphotransferase system IIB component